jgi:hypothetical protein
MRVRDEKESQWHKAAGETAGTKPPPTSGPKAPSARGPQKEY